MNMRGRRRKLIRSCPGRSRSWIRRSAPATAGWSRPLVSRGESLVGARDELASMSRNFDVRKLAACTNSDSETFYILCGWMAEKDARAFQKEVEGDKDLFCYVEDDNSNVLSQPPTKLKNPKIFRPFEMFIKMYGLPAYNELDPTVFVAITYSFIFGIMFGDVGQGAAWCWADF